MPDIKYLRCERPFCYMVEAVRRVVREERLTHAIFDSVVFACDGAPENAEVASRYFQALRQLGSLGSMHIAHVTKAEGADKKPFGSTFWHNAARSTWNVKLAGSMPGDKTISIGLYHRKANLGALQPAVGFDIRFADDTTTFKRVDLADVPELAANLSVRQRMALTLRHGSLTPTALAEEIDADVETVRRTARR